MWQSDDDSEQTNSSDDDIIALLDPQVINKSKTPTGSKPLLSYQNSKSEYHSNGSAGTFQHIHKQNHGATHQKKKNYDIDDILSSMNKSENIVPKIDSKNASEKINSNCDKQVVRNPNYPLNEANSSYHPPKTSASNSPKSNTSHTNISQGAEAKSLPMSSSFSTASLNRQISKSSSSSKRR